MVGCLFLGPWSKRRNISSNEQGEKKKNKKEEDLVHNWPMGLLQPMFLMLPGNFSEPILFVRFQQQSAVLLGLFYSLAPPLVQRQCKSTRLDARRKDISEATPGGVVFPHRF